jgi:glycosyltransferase 2 family protein
MDPAWHDGAPVTLKRQPRLLLLAPNLPKSAQQMRHLLALGAKVAVSASLLYLAFSRVDLGAIGSRLEQAMVSWLVALVTVLSIQLVLVALRWRLIGLQCAASFSIPMAIRYVLIASFFNQTLPSTVGGDAARIWFVSRAGAGWKAAIYSVIVDRVVGMAVLVAVVAICLPWLIELVRDPWGRGGLLLVNGAAIVGTATFLIIGRIHAPWLKRNWAMHHIAGTAEVALRVLSNRRRAGEVIGISITIHLLTVTAVWCAARATSVPLEFGPALLLVPPVVLIATIPISIAGWGVREGAMMAVFAYAGLSQVDGLLVSVLFGAGLFVVGMVGGLIWIVSSEQKIEAPGRLREM